MYVNPDPDPDCLLPSQPESQWVWSARHRAHEADVILYWPLLILGMPRSGFSLNACTGIKKKKDEESFILERTGGCWPHRSR